MRTRRPTVPETEPSFRMPRTLPVAVVTGIVTGVIGGFGVGAIVGPLGVGLGFGLGLAAGTLAGNAMAKDDRRRARRTNELDAIIGVTEGSLGAGPVSLVPARDADEAEGRVQWVAEWLTPPPPHARGI